MDKIPSGQGNSRGARRRRAKRLATEKTTTQTKIQTQTRQVQNNGQRPRRQNPRNRTPGRQRNWYFDDIINPFRKSIVGRVPDVSAISSSPLTVTLEGTAIPDANGFYGVQFVPRMVNPIWVSNTAGFGAAQATATGSGVAFTQVQWPASASMQANYVAYRPVAAGIHVECTNNNQTNQGLICCWYASKYQNTNLPTTMGTALALNEQEARNFKDGSLVFWKPQDNADFEYTASNAAGTLYPFIGFIISGSSGANAANIYVKFTATFECIPSSDTFTSTQGTPSPVNPRMVDEALSTLSSIVPTYSTEGVNSLLSYMPPFLTATGTLVATRIMNNRANNYLGYGGRFE